MSIQYISSIETKQQQQTKIYGLCLFHTEWGNINFITPVKTTEELKIKFSSPDKTTEFEHYNNWLQAYNFLGSSPNLKVFRVAPPVPVPSYDGSENLTSVTGSSNSHGFFRCLSDWMTNHSPMGTWNRTDNGATLFYKMNDIVIQPANPTMNDKDLLFSYAKYPGALGNRIGVSIANCLTDMKNKYVFKYNKLEIDNNPGLIVGSTITGRTSGVNGIVMSIENKVDETITGTDAKNIIIYYESLNDTSFNNGETLDSNTTGIGTCVVVDNFSTLNNANTCEQNIAFSELFTESLRQDEIAVVLTLDNTILEYGVYSLDNSKDNFIENNNSNYVEFIVNDSYVNPSDMSFTDLKDYIVTETTDEKLLFGASTKPTVNQILTQLDLLKNDSHSRFEIIFHEVFDETISQKISTDVLRLGKIAVLNNYLSVL